MHGTHMKISQEDVYCIELVTFRRSSWYAEATVISALVDLL